MHICKLILQIAQKTVILIFLLHHLLYKWILGKSKRGLLIIKHQDVQK